MVSVAAESDEGIGLHIRRTACAAHSLLVVQTAIAALSFAGYFFIVAARDLEIGESPSPLDSRAGNFIVIQPPRGSSASMLICNRRAPP